MEDSKLDKLLLVIGRGRTVQINLLDEHDQPENLTGYTVADLCIYDEDTSLPVFTVTGSLSTSSVTFVLTGVDTATLVPKAYLADVAIGTVIDGPLVQSVRFPVRAILPLADD